MVLRRLVVVFALCLAMKQTEAQVAPGPAPTPLTLAKSLTLSAVPEGEVVLAVGAEKVTLPTGVTVPIGADPAAVAAAYGAGLHHFRAVQAVGAATMTVLNSDPINPNPYDGLGPGDAMKLLAASLTDGQWRALTGEQGLGMNDLSSDTQRQLFLLLLPEPLLISPLPVRGQASPDASETRDVTGEREAIRLRLRRNNVLYLPLTGENIYLPAAQFDAPGGTRHYRMRIDGFFRPQPEIAGVPVRADVPNAPKEAQLDYEAPSLKTTIPLTGLKTVGDLVFRVGTMTHTEVYPDARYEKKPLTMAGHAASVPAADLLRAIAFCVTGTFRRVENAYVLTDDVVGVGTKREIWTEFEDDADGARQAALDAAGDKLAAGHTLRELSPAADMLPLNAEEQKQADAPAQEKGTSAEVLLNQMSPAQQEMARNTPGTSENGVPVPPDFTRKILLDVMPQLELLVPSMPGPVDYNASGFLVDLFQTAEERRRTLSADATLSTNEMPGTASGERLEDVLKKIPHRAALAAPADAAALKSLLALMQKTGLNELWLPVPPMGDGLLPDALRSAAGTGITVRPVLDVFAWPSATPRPLQDLTILGETSVAAAERQRRRAALRAAYTGDAPPPSLSDKRSGFVSPFSPEVAGALGERAQALSATPGVTGLVWRATTPPGYDVPTLRSREDQSGLLGYTPAARLAFIREAHVDPIDLFPGVSRGRADTHLPNFDDPGLEETLVARWRQRRASQDMSVLRSLFRAVPEPPLVLEHGPGANLDWFGSWDSADVMLPTYQRTDVGNVTAQARAQSHTIFLRLPFREVLTVGNLADRWRGALETLTKTKQWDGFVLDMTPD